MRVLADLPLADSIPVAFDACRQGPRQIEWRDDKPAELAWIECQVWLGGYWRGWQRRGDRGGPLI